MVRSNTFRAPSPLFVHYIGSVYIYVTTTSRMFWSQKTESWGDARFHQRHEKQKEGSGGQTSLNLACFVAPDRRTVGNGGQTDP